MSLKYSSTTADYLVWSDAMNLIRKLAKDENYKISLLIALGCFTGLRISDGEFYQFNLSSCIRQQNSLTAQFVSFSLSNLANIFYPPNFYNN